MNIETDSKSKGMTTGGVITKININASSSRMGKKFKKMGAISDGTLPTDKP